MTSQTPKTNQEKALDAFLAKKAEIDERLARLQALSDDHFEVHPDDVNWSMSTMSPTTPTSSRRSPTWPSTRASTPAETRPGPPPPRAAPQPGLGLVGAARVRPDDPETPTMPTNLSKTELATILSALDGQPRNPANRDKALAAIERRAAALGLTTDEILDAAPGLLDGRLSPEDWLAEITEDGQAKVERVTAEVVAAVKAGSAERAAAAEPEAQPLPKLTRGERQLLVNIARNLMTPVNGAEPATLDEAGSVWRDCLDQGPETIKPTSLPGLVASLTKKGLATTNGESVGLTAAGLRRLPERRRRGAGCRRTHGRGEAADPRRHQAGDPDRHAPPPRGRRPRRDRRGHRLAEAHHPGRHLRRPEEEARPRGHLDQGPSGTATSASTACPARPTTISSPG
jgi:hypothetical protein